MFNINEWRRSGRKALAALLCSICMVFTLAAPASAAGNNAALNSGVAVVSEAAAAKTIAGTILSAVNLRKGPSTDFDVIVTLSQGDNVIIKGKSSSMYKVTAIHKSKVYTGYVLGTCVKSDKVPASMELKKVPFPNKTNRPEVGKTYYVNKSVRLRSSATAISDIVTSLSVNDPCLIKGYGSGWYKVTAKHAGQKYTGFVNNEYLSATKTKVNKPSETKPVKNKTGYVNYLFLNVRAKASTTAQKIDELYKTQAVKILNTSNGWYKIQYVKNTVTKTGFVSAEYITVTTTGKTNIKVNFRAKANVNSAKLGSLGKGTKVKILKESNGWLKVKVTLKGSTFTGFVKGEYVDV